jgi:hypothetical protein
MVLVSQDGICWADSPPRRELDYGQTLCAPAERVYFSCRIGLKTVSLCGSEQLTKTSGYLQYRFGRIGIDPELIYPPTQMHPRGQFWDYLSMSAQAVFNEIGFQLEEYRYRIIINTAARVESFGYGVTIEKNGKLLKTLRCADHIYEDRTALFRIHDQELMDAARPASRTR